MKTIVCIILALVATALTVLIMPVLASFGPATAPKPSFTAIKTVRIQPPNHPQKPSVRTSQPQTAPPEASSRDLQQVSLPTPASEPQAPPPPELHLSPVLPTPDIPSIPLDLAFDITPAPPSAHSIPVSAPSQPSHSSSGSGRRDSRASMQRPQSAPPSQPHTPLSEKHIVTPSFPRNAALVNGSVHLAFTVNSDGTVSDVEVISCDAQLSFKYRREAIRATLKSIYHPATRNGKPISIRATRRIDFIVP